MLDTPPIFTSVMYSIILCNAPGRWPRQLLVNESLHCMVGMVWFRLQVMISFNDQPQPSNTIQM